MLKLRNDDEPYPDWDWDFDNGVPQVKCDREMPDESIPVPDGDW